MGILSENEYKISIIPKTFLEYFIPFKTKNAYSLEEAYNTATNLLNKGYNIRIEEKVLFTADYNYGWLLYDLGTLEKKLKTFD